MFDLGSAVLVAIGGEILAIQQSRGNFAELTHKIEATAVEIIGTFHYDVKIGAADKSAVSADATGAHKQTMQRHYASQEAIKAAAGTVLMIMNKEAERCSHGKYGLSTFFAEYERLNGADPDEYERFFVTMPVRVREWLDAFGRFFKSEGPHGTFKHPIKFP